MAGLVGDHEPKVEEEETSPFLSPDIEPGTKYANKWNQFSGLSSHTKKRCLQVICTVTVLGIVLAAVLVTGLLVGKFAVKEQNEGSLVSFLGNETTGSSDCTLLHQQEICSNPPLLLVSMDGFRPSYLSMYQGNTSFLTTLASKGVRPQYMRSVFPSKTFPNHFSIVTGLYPDSHGIVGNSFYDKNIEAKFSIGGPTQNSPKWWLGEPVWVTAEKSGLKTGAFFWPGSEVDIEGTVVYRLQITYPCIQRKLADTAAIEDEQPIGARWLHRTRRDAYLESNSNGTTVH